MTAEPPQSPGPQSSEYLKHLYRGSELLLAERIDEARQALEEATRIDPEDPKGLSLLALVYFRLEEFERAQQIYELLVSRFPAEASLRVNLGLVYMKQGAQDAALAQMLEAVSIDPNHQRAYGYLGLLYSDLGRHQEARDAFARAGQDAMVQQMDALLAGETKSRIARGAPEPSAAPQTPAEPHAPAEPERPGSVEATSGDSQTTAGAPTDGAEKGTPAADVPPPPQQSPVTAAAMQPVSFGPHAADPGAPAAAMQPMASDAMTLPVSPTAPPTPTTAASPDPSEPASAGVPAGPGAPASPGETALPEEGTTADGSPSESTAPEASAPATPSALAPESDALAPEPPAPARAEPTDASAETRGAPTPDVDAAAHPSASPGAPPATTVEPSSSGAEVSGSSAPATGDEAAPLAEAPAAAVLQPELAEEDVAAAVDAAVAPEEPWPAGGFAPAAPAAAPAEPTAAVDAPVSEPERREDPGVQPIFGFATTGLLDLGNGGRMVPLSRTTLWFPVEEDAYLRERAVLAQVGEIRFVPAYRRVKGANSDEPLRDENGALVKVLGEGGLLLETGGPPLLVLDLFDDFIYIRQECIFAFESTLHWENGKIRAPHGEIPLVHVRGEGRIALQCPGPVYKLRVVADQPLAVSGEALLGWVGRVIPETLPSGAAESDSPLIRCEGEGVLLLRTPAPKAPPPVVQTSEPPDGAS